MKKRLVAVLMTAAMVCSMGSVSAVSVFAEEETAEAAGDEDVVYVDPLEAEDGLPFAATELSKGKTIGVSVFMFSPLSDNFYMLSHLKFFVNNFFIFFQDLFGC